MTNTTTTYTPRHDSLAQHVCTHLQLHTGMTLGIDDIQDKFKTSRGNVHTQLRDPVEAGWLTRSRNEDGEYVYSAGPELPSIGVDMDAVHANPKRARASTVFADATALQITDDPLPASRAMPGCKYHPVFERMRPGQCVRCATGDVGKVTGALRKYLQTKKLTGQIKSTKAYEGDEGFGRVWLLDAKAA